MAIIAIVLVAGILLAAFAPILPIAHDYPDPGTPEWSSVDREELTDAVSPYHASRMTDAALIKTVADWPFLVDISAFNTVADGVKVVSETYPCMKELQRRIHRDPLGMARSLAGYVVWENWRLKDAPMIEKIHAFDVFRIGLVCYFQLVGMEDNPEAMRSFISAYREMFLE